MIYGFDLHTTGRLITLLDFMVLLKHTDDTMHRFAANLLKALLVSGTDLYRCYIGTQCLLLTYSKKGVLGQIQT